MLIGGTDNPEQGEKRLWHSLGGDDIFKTTLEKEGVVIMGNEGNGISERIRKLVTHSLMIPANCPQSCPDSLNVAVATGIVLAEFRGHRN